MTKAILANGVGTALGIVAARLLWMVCTGEIR